MSAICKSNAEVLQFKNKVLHQTNPFFPLPNDKILDWSKVEAFADNKINKGQSVQQRRYSNFS